MPAKSSVEVPDKDVPLRDDIRLLGRILGDTVREQEGEATFEIVERIRSRGSVHRMFTGFLVDGPLPAPGTKIQIDGKEAGEITSAASLPLADGDRIVALGYVRRELAGPGNALTAGVAKLTIARVPFTEVFHS